jgi:hypothetical protein
LFVTRSTRWGRPLSTRAPATSGCN